MLKPGDVVVVEFLALYPPNVRDIALAVRELVVHTVPDATETVDRSARLIGYGYGPGYKDTICTLLMSRTGVKVGIGAAPSCRTPRSYCKGAARFTGMCNFELSPTSQTPGSSTCSKLPWRPGDKEKDEG